MNQRFFFVTIIIAVVSHISLSCKKEISCESCGDNPPGNNTNKSPIAVAGPDQAITLPADSAILDGSASRDPDGRISSWLWKKIEGPASFSIHSSTDSVTRVRNLVVGAYQFELSVTDNNGLSSKDSLQIVVRDPSQPNRPPVANAGPDQTIILPSNSGLLYGSGSSDPDHNISSYLWTKISGPALFSVANPGGEQTMASDLVEGTYAFELKVTDAGGLFSVDTMQMTVSPGYPCMINLPQRPAVLTQIGNLSVPRMTVAATAGNKILFAGGWASFSCNSSSTRPSSPSSVVDIYDYTNNMWATAQLSRPRGGLRTVTCGSKVFFAGGEDGVSSTYDEIDIYDVSSNTWSVAHLSLPRAYVATASVGNKVFFAGGVFYNGNSQPSVPKGVSNRVDIYDLSTGQWSTATLSGTTRDLSTAAVLAGKVYFSGSNENGIIDIYDNSTGTWSTRLSPFQWLDTWGNPTVSFAAGSNIYWGGVIDEGFDPGYGDNIYTGRAEILNTSTNTISVQCMPISYSEQPVNRNNEIAFFSSYDSFRSPAGWTIANVFKIYNTTTNSWSMGRTDNNFFTYGYDNAIIQANGKIYVGGGNYVAGSCLGLTNKVYVLSW